MFTVIPQRKIIKNSYLTITDHSFILRAFLSCILLLLLERQLRQCNKENKIRKREIYYLWSSYLQVNVLIFFLLKQYYKSSKLITPERLD